MKSSSSPCSNVNEYLIDGNNLQVNPRAINPRQYFASVSDGRYVRQYLQAVYQRLET